MKLTKTAAVNLTTLQGCRQWGEPVVPGPPFKICAPYFMFGSRLLHISNILFKNVCPPCCNILAKGVPHCHYTFIEYHTGLV